MNWFGLRKRNVNAEQSGMKKVSMYTLSTCPSCEKAKKFFTQHQIPFEFTNYDLVDETMQDKIMHEIEAEEVEAFPFVRIGDHTVQGYDPKRYARLLGINL